MIVSVDVEHDSLRFRSGLVTSRWSETSGGRIAALLERYRVSATWGLADPAVSIATECLRGGEVPHEIGILAQDHWAKQEAGRAHFHRELARRVAGARSAGIEVTSLIVRDRPVPDHWDLMSKQGIVTVRGADDTARAGGPWPAPRQLRFGIWEMPGSIRVPAAGSWLASLGNGRRTCRWIDRAIAEGKAFHLVLDGSLLQVAGSAGEAVLNRVIRHADRRRQQGLLAIETMLGATARLNRSKNGSPATSILRPRAA